MACKYEVVIDGVVVWSHETDEYEGWNTFPAEYRGRPESGAVHLIVNGETIGVQTPLDPNDPAAAADPVMVIAGRNPVWDALCAAAVQAGTTVDALVASLLASTPNQEG